MLNAAIFRYFSRNNGNKCINNALNLYEINTRFREKHL